MNATITAKLFGCTPEQARRQYLRNAAQLGRMADKAQQMGGKVNGFTASDLRNLQGKALKHASR